MIARLKKSAVPKTVDFLRTCSWSLPSGAAGKRFCAALPVFLLLAAACSGGRASEQIIEHLVVDASGPTFDLSTIGSPAELLVWSFEEPDSLSAWSFVNVDRELRHDGGALALQASNDDPQMQRATDLYADALRELEIRIAGLVQGHLKVYWARADQEFSEARAVTIEPAANAAPGSEWRTVRAHVSQHPEWRGRIERLRIDPTDHPGERVRITSVRGSGLVPAPDLIAEAADKEWRVGLSNDHRPALLVPLNGASERRLAATGGASLRFGYGVKCVGDTASSAPQAIRFEVLADAGDGAARSIFTADVAAASETGGPPYGGWREGVADLPASDELRLVFRVSSSPSPVDIPCLAAWASSVVLARPAEPPPPNVILISIDTLRSDRVSLYAGRSGLTPAIDAWARRRAVTFPNAIVAAPWTLPSHASMLSGFDALSHGVNHDLPAPAYLLFLAERLRAAAYTTAAFTGGGYLDHRFGFSQGFDRYIGWSGGVADEQELASNMDRLLDWMRSSTTRPFFAFFHTYEVHEPYRRRRPYFDELYSGPLAARAGDVTRVPSPPVDETPAEQPLRWRFSWHSDRDAPTTAELIELVNALYDSGVAYTDEVLGRLFHELERLGLEDHTIVVLTSDHGEALGEQELASHGYLSNDNLVVPLIIAAPGIRAGSVRSERVRSTDIVPTILDLIGLEPGPMDGRSLAPLLEGAPAEPEDAWAYSAAWGVSWRTSEGLEYLFDPTPWPGRRGHESLYSLLAGTPETRSQVLPDAATASLRQSVMERLESIPGVSVRFRNDGDRPITGELHLIGRPLGPAKIKAPGLPCDCLQWNPRGSLQFTVPPGTGYLVRLHEIYDDGLIFEGAIGNEAFHARIDPAEIDAQRSLSLAEPGGQFVTGDLADDVGITVWRTGPIPGADTLWTPSDPDLLRRLRALGYLR